VPFPFDATLKDLVTRHPTDFGTGFHLHGPAPLAVLNADLSLVSAATDVVLAFGTPPGAMLSRPTEVESHPGSSRAAKA
jgi:hypothetical protein